MKKQYKIMTGKGIVEREYNHIPIRYVIALLITLTKIVATLGAVLLLCRYVPIFYALCMTMSVLSVIKIIASDDNPDYKVPWLIIVILMPIAGAVLYLMFYSRKLKRRYIKRIREVESHRYSYEDTEAMAALASEDKMAASQAKMLTEISRSHVFRDTEITYFPSGRDMLDRLLSDLEAAEKFIFLEFFIIEDGVFWDTVLEVLKRKASEGVDVRVMYDDIGCMSTLPGNYNKILRKHGIDAVIFSKLRGSADSEMNNRDHRKIIVIDGTVGYTGGVNIADEYIGERVRFGEWKDSAVRLLGDAVHELTWLFLSGFGMSSKTLLDPPKGAYPESYVPRANGYVIPFGDGPRQIYKHSVSKSAIQNMIGSATEYVYMTTPYLIIDNDLCSDIERAAMRGVDVRIAVPHIPDKRLVFAMTRSFYHRLMDAGVKIYEYEPGFIHSKTYVADGKYAIVGTVNLDYRSLVHHFEDGVWMYGTDAIADIKRDVDSVLAKSIIVTPDMLRMGVLRRFLRAVIRIFAPML